jgi:GTP cyclohydrolase I
MLTVQDVYDFINEVAPFATQEDYDNSGLLVGHPVQEVHHIHFALDCTMAVAQEAENLDADLIVTHHPLMFSARKNLREDDGEGAILCRMIRNHQSLIAAHTCLDRAPGGMNDVLANAVGLTDVTGEDFLRVGNLPRTMTVTECAAWLSEHLHTVVRPMGNGNKTVHRMGLCSGAGSELWQDAWQNGADAFLSGEIHHHHALAACQHGVTCFECGHAATETIGIFALADALQKHADAVQWNVRVTKSLLDVYDTECEL